MLRRLLGGLHCGGGDGGRGTLLPFLLVYLLRLRLLLLLLLLVGDGVVRGVLLLLLRGAGHPMLVGWVLLMTTLSCCRRRRCCSHSLARSLHNRPREMVQRRLRAEPVLMDEWIGLVPVYEPAE